MSDHDLKALAQRLRAQAEWERRHPYGVRFEHALTAEELTVAAEALEGLSPERAQWQPIATAPKDGRDVLLTDGASYKRVGNWARLREVWAIDALPPVNAPTHWAPIPTEVGAEPPADQPLSFSDPQKARVREARLWDFHSMAYHHDKRATEEAAAWDEFVDRLLAQEVPHGQ